MIRFGLAVRRWAGKRKVLGSTPLRLSFHFKSCGLWTILLCPIQILRAFVSFVCVWGGGGGCACVHVRA